MTLTQAQHHLDEVKRLATEARDRELQERARQLTSLDSSPHSDQSSYLRTEEALHVVLQEVQDAAAIERCERDAKREAELAQAKLRREEDKKQSIEEMRRRVLREQQHAHFRARTRQMLLDQKTKSIGEVGIEMTDHDQTDVLNGEILPRLQAQNRDLEQTGRHGADTHHPLQLIGSMMRVALFLIGLLGCSYAVLKTIEQVYSVPSAELFAIEAHQIEYSGMKREQPTQQRTRSLIAALPFDVITVSSEGAIEQRPKLSSTSRSKKRIQESRKKGKVTSTQGKFRVSVEGF